MRSTPRKRSATPSSKLPRGRAQCSPDSGSMHLPMRCVNALRAAPGMCPTQRQTFSMSNLGSISVRRPSLSWMPAGRSTWWSRPALTSRAHRKGRARADSLFRNPLAGQSTRRPWPFVAARAGLTGSSTLSSVGTVARALAAARLVWRAATLPATRLLISLLLIGSVGASVAACRSGNGEIYDMDRLSAASPTLPLPVYARVTNLENHRSIIVRVNDRGPYANDRIMDLSRRSAELLGFRDKGTAPVRVQYLARAPLNGDDSYERRYLASQGWAQVASHGGSREPAAVGSLAANVRPPLNPASATQTADPAAVRESALVIAMPAPGAVPQLRWRASARPTAPAP